MAHQRQRYLKFNLEKAAAYSPLVGILGHRQVGKTTLLEQLTDHYITLDDFESLKEVQDNPTKFLMKNSSHLTAIDECQIAPELFPALKEKVRKNKRPGQYLLSGSVRFTSRKAIRESLTGRIVNFELLPFSIREINHKENPTLLTKLIETPHLDHFIHAIQHDLSKPKSSEKDIELYLKNGGLPGICFIREAALKKIKLTDQLATLLDRDLRMVYPTSVPFSQLLEYVRLLSENEGQIIRYQHFKKVCGLAEQTQKKLLYALEAIFLIRLLPSEGGEKGFTLYFEDQAEALFLDKNKSEDTQLEALYYRNIRTQFNYTPGESFRFFHYSTRGGARVPFCIETKGLSIGFIPIKEKTPDRSQLATANSFLKTFEKSKVVFLTPGKNAQVISNRSIVLPRCAVI